MNKRKIFSIVVAMFMAFATFVVPVSAADTYSAKLYGKITDAGQVVSKMVIDYGSDKTVSGIDKDTYTVHATNTIQAGANAGNTYYDVDRTIVKVEVSGSEVTVYFDETEGATLTYLSEARNYPGKLEYTITQQKAINATALDGRVLADINATYTCDNSVDDEETKNFTSVTGSNGINYQLHKGTNDKLIVWFHGNGEGDLDNSGNNVAQMLANRGTVAWTTDEAKAVFGDATVMSFQAPDTWYYAQTNNYLEKAYNEINEVIAQNNIDKNKVIVSGCSAGGYMTTRMIIKYPSLFASAMINCPALSVATARGGETPTDAELESIKNSKTAIWLVQGVTDSSVKREDCSQRLFDILTKGQTLTTTKVDQPIASDYTTYETSDNKYKLSLYETVDQEDKVDSLGETRKQGKLQFAEDYDQDGVETLVKYSDHWSWIYTLRNNPTSANGTHIWNWAVSFAKTENNTVVPNENASNNTTTGSSLEKVKSAKTGDDVSTILYGMLLVISGSSYIVLKRRKENI
ncbi:MAG: prolyl oligopeptidase family serine peptidase [Thomasclavelia sp.]|nr:prolyl oligopeptidase family serine peptidase [Thomasclavelia sp.]